MSKVESSLYKLRFDLRIDWMYNPYNYVGWCAVCGMPCTIAELECPDDVEVYDIGDRKEYYHHRHDEDECERDVSDCCEEDISYAFNEEIKEIHAGNERECFTCKRIRGWDFPKELIDGYCLDCMREDC